MSKFSEQIFQLIQECCGVGGVTTASFAPAVTNTIYPKPGSKKSKFRKKTEDLLQEVDWYDDDDEDSSEQYWPDWSKANWGEYEKNKKDIENKANKPKEDFCNKYKARNDAYAKKLDDLYTQYSQDENVDLITLKNVFDRSKRQLVRAIVDCDNYKKMSAEEFNKLPKPIRMKPIDTNIEYWRVRKLEPWEYNN